MSARGNVSAEEWRAMARAAVAGQPGPLVADGDGPPRLAADVPAEAAAEKQQAELNARALLAAGDAMAGRALAGERACDPSASPRWPRCGGRRSEERPLGTAVFSTCKSRWSRYHKKKNNK